MLLTNRIMSTFDPLRVMRAIEDQWSQHFGDWLEGTSLLATQGGLRLWTGDGQAVVEFDLPGCSPEQFDLSIHQDLLTVNVTPAEERAEASGEYHVRERISLSQRQVRLPFTIDPQQTVAEYRHGVLRVSVRQPEAHRPARIAVKGL
jgi:HSP20 family protein